MTLTEAKRLFRRSFPVKQGGPTDKARSAGAIACFDAVAEQAFGNTTQITTGTITDATAAGRAMLKATSAAAQLKLIDSVSIDAAADGTYPSFTTAYGSAGLLLWLLGKVSQLLRQVGAIEAPSAPAAPTDGQPDDDGDRFSGLAVPGFASYAEYEATGMPGTTGIVPLTPANSSQSGSRIYLKGLTGPIAKGGVGFRVAASGNRPAGAFLMNLDPFTGPAAVAKGYGTLYTDQYPPAA